MAIEFENITEDEMEKKMQSHFASWLEIYVKDPANEVDELLIELAEGPGRRVTCYNGYFANGFRFHTAKYGANRKTMNSGICVKGTCYEDPEKDYYGMVQEIVELEYMGAGNKVVLFRCLWYDNEKGIRVHKKHGFVEVNMTSKLLTDEEFVLAEQATQVYYVNYASKKRNLRDWSIAYKVRPSGRPDIPIVESDLVAFQEDEISADVNVDLTNDDGEDMILVDGTNVEEVSLDELRRGLIGDEGDEEDEEDEGDEGDEGDELNGANSENSESGHSDSDDHMT